MSMKFIGLLILSSAWLGFVFVDSGNITALMENTETTQNFISPKFLAAGFIPVLIGWSVFLGLTAVIESRNPKI